MIQKKLYKYLSLIIQSEISQRLVNCFLQPNQRKSIEKLKGGNS